ncbi:hypothetical protein EDD11_002309 [Mortierella claussenii]|nr:hypothetical protein EDD11_002309 [Mortierella claussenii]
MPSSAGCLDTFRGLFTTSQARTLYNNGARSSGNSSVHGSSSSFHGNSSSSGIQAPLAIVDMGSNGIRFGIIASLDRHLPVLYEERAPISLFEAQFSSDMEDDPDVDIDVFQHFQQQQQEQQANKKKGGLKHSSSGKTSASTVTPSISNAATIAAMAQQSDENGEAEEDRAHDDDDMDDDGYDHDGRHHDAKEALRRTLVATDDNDMTLTVGATSSAPFKNGGSSAGKANSKGGVLSHSNHGSNPVSERQPISEKVIDEVVRTFERWQALCHQANVQTVRVIATEATRTAPNSEEFQARIKAATGWSVELLTKAQEANIGALGVMASYHTVQGLFMDLGGGSVQLNYIIRGPQDGHGKSSLNAQSWPYGAAALSRRLNNCGQDQAARQEIYEEMIQAFKHGLEDIDIAPAVREHNEKEGGYRMYLSGGGFRALGYLLMARKMKGKKKDKGDNNVAEGTRYPIPIINGYVASGKELAQVVQEYRHFAPDQVEKCFRVSKRRAKLIPACATLMAAVMEVIPIKDVLFSEGGVRQGGCFGMLPTEIQNKDPAFETVQSFVRAFGGGQPPLHESDLLALSSFVSSALPADFANCCRRTSSISSSANAQDSSDHTGGLSDKDAAELQVFIDSLPRLIPLLVLVMNCYNHLPKEARSTAAWQLFLPGGALANCYGLTHSDRAILASVLSERHEGDLADPGMGDTVKKLIPGGKVACQAVKYLGKILTLAGLCSPLPGTATLLLSGGGLPNKHGSGRVTFEQSPGTSNGRRHRRDPDRTRVGEDPSSGESEDEHERDVENGLENRVIVLQQGLLPSGVQAHGQVVLKVEKGHPLLMAPNVQDAVKALAEAAAKTHGFTGALLKGEPSDMKKGKGVNYNK